MWANNVRRSKTFPSAILKFKRIVSLSALWSATARTLRILVPPGKTSPPGRWRTYVRLHTDNTRTPPSAARGNRRRSPPCSRGKRRHVRAAGAAMFARRCRHVLAAYAAIRSHLPLPPSWLFEISMRNLSPTGSCIIRLGGQAAPTPSRPHVLRRTVVLFASSLWLGGMSRPQPQRFRSYFADPCGEFKIVA